MKEEDEKAEPAVEDGEHGVEGHVLLVLSKGTQYPVGIHQGHEDEVGALREPGTCQLGTVHAWNGKIS